MEGDGKGWIGFAGNGVERVKRERACGRGEEKESELPELNQRPLDLQSNALPTELSSVCWWLKGWTYEGFVGEGGDLGFGWGGRCECLIAMGFQFGGSELGLSLM